MPLDPPTLGEVLRRLDEVAQRLESVATKLDESQERAARTYVRQDVYLAERQSMESNIADIRSDVATVSTKSGERHDKVNERLDQLQAQQKAAENSRRQFQLQLAGLAIAFLSLLAAVIFNLVR